MVGVAMEVEEAKVAAQRVVAAMEVEGSRVAKQVAEGVGCSTPRSFRKRSKCILPTMNSCWSSTRSDTAVEGKEEALSVAVGATVVDHRVVE